MKISDDIRKLIVESYLHGHGNKQISSMFNVKYQTVCTIISVYKKESRFEKKLKGGQRKKVLKY